MVHADREAGAAPVNLNYELCNLGTLTRAAATKTKNLEEPQPRSLTTIMRATRRIQQNTQLGSRQHWHLSRP
jgi:hypothetical protein